MGVKFNVRWKDFVVISRPAWSDNMDAYGNNFPQRRRLQLIDKKS